MIDSDLCNGEYLLVVEDGKRSLRPIESAFPEVEAAMHYCRESMVEAMHEKSKMRPKETRISEKEKRAWEAFKKEMGEDHVPTYFVYPSLSDIADAGVESIRDKANENRKKYIKKTKKHIDKINTNSISSLEV